MICLTETECADFAGRLGLDILDGGGVKFRRQWQLASAQLAIPTASSVQSVMINAIFESLGERSQYLIWCKDWGIFSSDEYPEIWTALRTGQGEHRSLREAPGHLFQPQESALARGMGRLSLLFSWDSFVITEPVRFITFMSHDGLLFFYGESKQHLHDLSKRLAQIDLRLVLL